MNSFLALSSLHHNNRSMGWTGKAGWPRYFLDHASSRGLEKCRDSRKLLAFSLKLHQQICCFSYLRRNMWPSCFFISCVLTCFSSLKIQQEEVHLGEPTLKLLAQYPAFITEHIATSLSEEGWHSTQWVTQCLGFQIYSGEEAHPILPAAWSQRCEEPSLSISSAAPADANTELNFMLIFRLISGISRMLTNSSK